MKNRFYNSNNRAVIDEDGNVAQVTNYYPFGGVFSTTVYNSGDDLQPYKYNGKELDRTHGLDWYDYDARQHDPFVPGFTSLDPHCESYFNISPYAYCGNNPVNAIDPNGMDMFHTENPETIRNILYTLMGTGTLNTDDCEVRIDDEYFVSHYYKNGNKYSIGYNVFSNSESNPTEINGDCKIISFYAAPESSTERNKNLSKINAFNGSVIGINCGMMEQGIAYCAYSKYGLTCKQFNDLSAKRQAFMLTKSGGWGTTGLYKTLKVAGGIGTALTFATSFAYGWDAWSNDRPDKYRRSFKALLDTGMAAYAVWGGPVGWGVSGAYFLVDVCGGWNYLLDIKED